MKKIVALLLLFGLFFNCSSDSSSIKNGTDGQGGSTAIFALAGNYLYAVDNFKLNIFSLIDANQPVKVNETPIGFAIETLFCRENYLYIGSRNGIYIYSIENPENPTYLADVNHFTACDPVIANATHSFVTLHSTENVCGNKLNALQVYNTTNINNPILVHARNLVSPKGLALYGNYLFVCDDVIKIFDIQNPNEPVLVHAIDKECTDLIISNNTVFAISKTGLYRYEINPNNILQITFKSQISL